MATKVDDGVPAAAAPPGTGPTGRSWWEWVLRFLPAAAFLATFGVFFVDKRDSARSVLESGKGLLTIAVIVVGYVVMAVTLRRFVKWSWVAPVVLTGIVLVLANWIVRPYYDDESGNRRLVKGPVADASEVEPPAPADEGAPSPTQAPAQPVRISTGGIQGLDHDASGSISLIRNPDGSLIARFENFDVEGTPDPRVYLVQGDNVQDPGGADLGAFETNRGSAFDYPVPTGTDAGPGWTVLVWCESFDVPIANATQAAA